MKIFFDTEFTGLHKNTTLISIGCVDELGTTFYAEFTDYDKTQVDDWIQNNVINNLSLYDDGWYDNGIDMTVKGNKEYISEKFKEWLAIYDDVQFISDVCHYDMVLLIDIFGTAFDLPKGVCASCHDINQDIASYYGCSEAEAFDKSREGILADYGMAFEGDKHNALYDAKVIKALYSIVG